MRVTASDGVDFHVGGQTPGQTHHDLWTHGQGSWKSPIQSS